VDAGGLPVAPRSHSLFPRAGLTSAPARTTAYRPKRASADGGLRRLLVACCGSEGSVVANALRAVEMLEAVLAPGRRSGQYPRQWMFPLSCGSCATSSWLARNCTSGGPPSACTCPSRSRAIRELERELGVVLFVRTTRRVELTSAGSGISRRSSSLRPATLTLIAFGHQCPVSDLFGSSGSSDA